MHSTLLALVVLAACVQMAMLPSCPKHRPYLPTGICHAALYMFPSSPLLHVLTVTESDQPDMMQWSCTVTNHPSLVSYFSMLAKFLASESRCCAGSTSDASGEHGRTVSRIRALHILRQYRCSIQGVSASFVLTPCQHSALRQATRSAAYHVTRMSQNYKRYTVDGIIQQQSFTTELEFTACLPVT